MDRVRQLSVFHSGPSGQLSLRVLHAFALQPPQSSPAKLSILLIPLILSKTPPTRLPGPEVLTGLTGFTGWTAFVSCRSFHCGPSGQSILARVACLPVTANSFLASEPLHPVNPVNPV